MKILIGGSPCTYWSIAQSKNRETTAEGLGWELFKNYLIAKEKFKPDYFLYENNWSAAVAIKEQIQTELGVQLMRINSALVSAQNRDRFYCFNWSVEPPEDRGILLKDVLQSGEDLCGNEKSYCLTATYAGAVPYNTIKRAQRSMVAEPVILQRSHGYNRGGVKAGKAPTLTATGSYQQNNFVVQPVATIGNNAKNNVYHVENGEIKIKGKFYRTKLADGDYIIRKLTPIECERLQTLSDGYTAAVSNTQRYKGIGNGWTAEVIIHILRGILHNVSRDEEIIVLSMYDGIGTGRYCLDKMGFADVKYYAYEIDKFAMKVAQSNFPDIIELGNAFDLRRPEWEIGKAHVEAMADQWTR